MGDLVIPAGFFHCEGGDGRIRADYGLRNEEKVLDELVRRKLPFKHRVQIGQYEVDFLVGQRIVVEVDGYIHALKQVVQKDSSKDEHLEALGFIILRITGGEAKNKGFLREFGSEVQRQYEKDLARRNSQNHMPLKGAVPQEKLQKFKTKLEQEEQRKQQTKSGVKPKKVEKAMVETKELTDAELFLQAIAELSKPRRK